MRKSQAATEYILLLGILLILLIPILYYALTTSSENIRINQADSAVVTLSKAADTVYALGPGNKKFVWVTIPSGTKMAISGNTILMKLAVYGAQSDISQTTKGTLEAGTIGDNTISTVLTSPNPVGKGTYYVKVEYQEDENNILIGDEVS